jgi:hypothetical protein
VQRPLGRPDIRTLTIFENRPANPEFFEHNRRWTVNDRIRRRLWVEALKGGDVIQIIPKAAYFGWVSRDEHEPETISYHQFNTGHFTTAPNSEKREIRLLTVEPGGFDDSLNACFSVIIVLLEHINSNYQYQYSATQFIIR